MPSRSSVGPCNFDQSSPSEPISNRLRDKGRGGDGQPNSQTLGCFKPQEARGVQKCVFPPIFRIPTQNSLIRLAGANDGMLDYRRVQPTKETLRSGIKRVARFKTSVCSQIPSTHSNSSSHPSASCRWCVMTNRALNAVLIDQRGIREKALLEERKQSAEEPIEPRRRSSTPISPPNQSRRKGTPSKDSRILQTRCPTPALHVDSPIESPLSNDQHASKK